MGITLIKLFPHKHELTMSGKRINIVVQVLVVLTLWAACKSWNDVGFHSGGGSVHRVHWEHSHFSRIFHSLYMFQTMKAIICGSLELFLGKYHGVTGIDYGEEWWCFFPWSYCYFVARVVLCISLGLSVATRIKNCYSLFHWNCHNAYVFKNQWFPYKA